MATLLTGQEEEAEADGVAEEEEEEARKVAPGKRENVEVVVKKVGDLKFFELNI
jgi:hypothetical protein